MIGVLIVRFNHNQMVVFRGHYDNKMIFIVLLTIRI